MKINPNNFIASSAYTVVLTLLFGASPFAYTRAVSNTSANETVPNLAGTWQINRDKSDDPQNKLREARSRSHGGGLLGSSRGNMETVRTKMEERMRSAEVLEIIQDDSELTVNETGDDRLVHTETFYTDGRKSDQGYLETIAKWHGNKFVVETKLERGGKLTRTYELQAGSRELHVTLRIENERTPQAISIRSVYDKIQ
jgi:hypothetical protein